MTYWSTFVLQWKLLLHLYIFYNKRYWGDLNIWNTYIQYMFKTLYMIHTKSIWKKFQLQMVLDYIQHTRILKMLHFIIVIWYILHIMNTIFLLVQYTPKRLTCICLLKTIPITLLFVNWFIQLYKSSHLLHCMNLWIWLFLTILHKCYSTTTILYKKKPHTKKTPFTEKETRLIF